MSETLTNGSGEFDLRERLSTFVEYARTIFGAKGLSLEAQIDWRIPRRLRGGTPYDRWERFADRMAKASDADVTMMVRLIKRTQTEAVIAVGISGEGVADCLRIACGIEADTPLGEVEVLGKPLDSRWYMRLPGLDARTGLVNNGSEAGFLDACLIFRGGVQDKIARLTALCEEESWGDYAIEAHGMKSSLRIIGAFGLGDMAASLESAARAGEMSKVAKLNGGFLDGLAFLGEILGSICVKKKTSAKRPTEALWRGILAAASNMDTEWLQELIDMLGTMSLTDGEREVANRLEECMREFDYDGAARILRGRRIG